jgi:MoxR-like ATPase
MFTWIPIHREAIVRILEFQDKQSDLLTILHEMEQQGLKVVSLQDEGSDGLTIPLTEIDPFTFLASFNRGVTDKNRRDNWAFLRTRLGLQAPVPDDFTGIPVLHNMTSRLFPYAREREKDHVPLLWQIARTAAGAGIETVDEKLFDRCINLETVGIRRLTICIFWINPENFLPADSKTTAYGKSNGVLAEPKDYQSYRDWLKEVTERLGDNYAQMSHDAHLFATKQTTEPNQDKGGKFTKWMGPLLEALRALGGSSTPQAVLQKIQELLALPESVVTEQMKSGQSRFRNQVAWARKYLVWEGLIESGERGVWALTDKGQNTKLDEQQAQSIARKWANQHKQSEDGLVLGFPFDSIFGSVVQAHAAFDLLESTLAKLGIKEDTADDDKRIALTLPKGGPAKMRLNFGNWAILTFRSSESDAQAVQFLCRQDHLPAAAEDDKTESPFADRIDGSAFTLAYAASGSIQDETSQVRAEFEESLGQAAKHFGRWNRSPWRDLHKPELLRMVFDRTERDRLLREGVAPSGEERPASNNGARGRTETPLSEARYWWLNANPKIWNFEETPVGDKQTYTSHNENGNKRQKYRYFQEVKPGDLLVGYVTSPQKEVVALCRITKGLHQTEEGEKIEFEKIEQFANPLAYETLQANPDLAKCEPLINNQGSLFRLAEDEYDVIRSLIDESNLVPPTEVESFDKMKAMKGVFLAEAQFDEMLAALREKKNVVLQGAPGVGKTYIARRLAYALIGSNDPQQIEMIQFHQSYSYEDFIQGFRPSPKGTFDLKYGIFHQFCRRAQRDESKDKPYIFIIDEINRGNLSKIFGELMMLIEADKRGKEHAIPLAYSKEADERFYIPDNLHLIGMMNTADRSLAMVDYALRRRFRFITLRPEFSSSTFRTSLVNSGAAQELANKIIERMTTLNDAIISDAKNLGPGYQIGHSYFCPRKGITADDDWYKRVIESEIVPLIQEYWFDNEQKVKEHRSALLA